MTKEQKDTMTVRVTSVGFAILVFALFKPLGMGDFGLRVGLGAGRSRYDGNRPEKVQ